MARLDDVPRGRVLIRTGRKPRRTACPDRIASLAVAPPADDNRMALLRHDVPERPLDA
jgi:hypothetical protein